MPFANPPATSIPSGLPDHALAPSLPAPGAAVEARHGVMQGVAAPDMASQSWLGLLRQLPLATDRPWIGLLVGVLMVLMAFALRIAIENSLPPGFPYITLFPAIILVAFLFGARAGLVAGGLGGLLCWYYLLAPVNSWALDHAGRVALGFYLFIVTVDVGLIAMSQSARRRLDEQARLLEIQSENRELLFRELQHRISNNLQVIASLLSIRQRGLKDTEAQAALAEAASRLNLIGRISRQLYDIDEMRAGLRPFLEKLGQEILTAAGREDVILEFSGDETIELVPEAAIPLALVFTELVSNSLEHGFPDRRPGTIAVMVRAAGQGRVQLDVRDDGQGLPPGFDFAATDSLGMKIARLLARQLGGELMLIPRTDGPGAWGRLTMGKGGQP